MHREVAEDLAGPNAVLARDRRVIGGGVELGRRQRSSLPAGMGGKQRLEHAWSYGVVTGWNEVDPLKGSLLPRMA